MSRNWSQILNKSSATNNYKINFNEINEYLLSNVNSYLNYILPGGKYEGSEYTVINPTRNDNNPGSFKINIRTGVWSDFATDDCGKDLISLYAYLFGYSSQYEAALELIEKFNMTLQKNTLTKSRPSNKNWIPITPVPKDVPKCL